MEMHCAERSMCDLRPIKIAALEPTVDERHRYKQAFGEITINKAAPFKFCQVGLVFLKIFVSKVLLGDVRCHVVNVTQIYNIFGSYEGK